MINLAATAMLAQYKRWADQRLFDSLAKLPADELDKERAGPLRNITGILNHVYVIDSIWLAHMQRREHGHQSRMEVPYPRFADLRNAQEEMNERYISWAAQQTDDSLSQEWEFNFLSGQPGVMTAGGMFLHAVNHATFHRGWITQLYFEIPAPPPLTDLCVYLTEVECEPKMIC